MQGTDTQTGTTDQTPAPIKSAAALDDTNLVTDSAAAARTCPECESLMTLLPDADDHEPGAPQLLRCTSEACGHVVEMETPGTEAVITQELAEQLAKAETMRCERCLREIVIERLGSGHSFKVIAGVEPGESIGSSADGFPVCPKDGVAMIPVGPVPVAEAFQHVQDALRAEEEGAQRLPFPAPAFNTARALHSIFRQNAEVDTCRRRYDDLKERASAAKKELDEEERLLGKMISEYARNEKEAEAAARGKLRPGQVSVCITEQRTGQPCSVCLQERKAAQEKGSNDPHQRLVSIQQHAARRGWELDEVDLVDLDRDQPALVEAIAAWAHDETVKLADVKALSDLVKRACVAGPNDGENGQHCTLCGTQLHNKADEGQGLTPHVEGAYVGTSCEGDPNVEASDESEQPEPARQPMRRHKSPKDAAAAQSKAKREASPEKPAKKKAAKKKR